MRRLLLLAIGLVTLLATTGCGLLDTVNELPGRIAGRGDSGTSADYSKPDQMAGALDRLRAALKGDDQVFRVTMGSDGAAVFTLTQAYRLVDGQVSPEISTGIHPTTRTGLPLASYDPAAAMTRLSQAAGQRGCRNPTRVAATVHANQTIIYDITCTLDGVQVQLVEGPAGDLLGDLDMTTREGLAKAFADVMGVQPSGLKYTVFGVLYDTPDGAPSLQTISGRTATMRTATVSDRVPVLVQGDTGVDSGAIEFDVTGITAATFAAVYEGARNKCGEVSQINLVVAQSGAVQFLSGSLTCPYRADRTGTPI